MVRLTIPTELSGLAVSYEKDIKVFLFVDRPFVRPFGVVERVVRPRINVLNIPRCSVDRKRKANGMVVGQFQPIEC